MHVAKGVSGCVSSLKIDFRHFWIVSSFQNMAKAAQKSVFVLRTRWRELSSRQIGNISRIRACLLGQNAGVVVADFALFRAASRGQAWFSENLHAQLR